MIDFDKINASLADPEFRTRIKTDPHAALGIPRDQKVMVVEDTADTMHVIVPPQTTLLQDEALSRLSGGSAYDYCASTAPSCVYCFSCE